jgi:hypothetical protein
MTINPDHRNGWQQAGAAPEPHHENGAVNGHAHAIPDERGAAAAISFLQRFHPAALWSLASFGPGANEIGPAQTFDPSTDKDAAYRFIRGLQGKHNIYFSVNCVGAKISKKAAKADIAEVHYLHVDADLPKKLNWSDAVAVTGAKEHMLAQLRAYGPAPTAIVWSGGGFQAFWRLSEIIVVNGDTELMASIERRMRRVQKAFGADPCHNADRIMRLPGTMNVLGPTKVRDGRRPERAELIEFHEDRIYDIEDFPEIEPEPSGPAIGAGHHGCHDSDDFERAREALRVIPADDYHIYLQIGMTLKSGFGDRGFGLYRDWAMTSIKFDDNDIRTKWMSIKPEGGVTIATLFFMARQHGWQDGRPPRRGRGRHDEPKRGSETPGGAQEKEGPDIAPDMSIVRRNRTAAPQFPLDVLGSAAGWVQKMAGIKNAPVDYVAVGLLVTAAGMIGPKRRAQAWEGWEEPSILWAILVGDPSLVKSPSLDPFREAVRTIERELNADFENRKARYELEKAAADVHKEEWKKQVKDANQKDVVPPPMPNEAVEPKEPTKVRVWISDITSEKMARLLGENPDGLVNFRDEIAGLFGSFDKYGGAGSDKSLWLETYGGRPHRYDRVSLDDSIDIPFCAVSLLGCIQPDRLNTMILSGDDDGLSARPLYAWPNPVRPRRPTETVDSGILLAALRRLRSLAFDFDRDCNPQAKVMPLSSDARFEFTSWWEHKQWDAKCAAAGRIAGAIGKLDGVALRLAQVIELLEWAWSGSNQPEPEQIGLESTKKALRLIDTWVRATLERVFAEASLPQAQRDAMTVGRWLLKIKPKKVNARELRRQPGFPGPKEAKVLDAALEVLVDASWLIPAAGDKAAGDKAAGDKLGRPRKDYLVNEAIYAEVEKG